MTVYVDEPRDYSDIARLRGLRHTVWAHLTADTEDELHAFAARIGLRRAWFQSAGSPKFHYDVTVGKRAQALAAGAKAIDWHEMGALVNARRAAQRSGSSPGNT